MTSVRVHGRARAAAVLFCVASVPVVVIVLVRWFYGVPLSSFRPFSSDEISYWHQALTFSTVGFNGGYYTLGELTNPSGITPFGPHGPGFPVVWGAFGALVGFHRHSPVVLNLLAISVAAWIWTLLSRLTTGRIALSGVLLATFWPMVFWAPTAMQETLHHAGAIAVAGFFAYALGATPRRSVIVAGWIALAVLTFIRPTWIVLLPLWALAVSHSKPVRVVLLTLGCSLILGVTLLVAYSRTTAPFPVGFFFLRVLSLSENASAIWHNLQFNVLRTFDPGEYEFLEILLRIQYWIWLAAATAIGWHTLRQHTSRRWQAIAVTPLMLGTTAMFIVLGLMLVLYTLTNWAEHRVLSAFLLFAALLATATQSKAGAGLAIALLLSNLAATKPFLDSFNAERSENFVWDRRGSYALSDAIEGRIAYRPGLSRWCNTLLTSQLPPHLIVVPAGVGISVVREPNEMRFRPRSHYLLLDEAALDDFTYPIRGEEIARLPYGTLYRNLDSDCP
jgi:hypothetical protein